MKTDMALSVVFVALVSASSIQGFLIGNGPEGFGGGGGGMCAPLHFFCPLQCSAYEKDGNGCEICHCKGDGIAATLAGAGQGKNYHAIQNPCIPSHRNCQLKCEAFVTGAGGMCEFCLCQHVQHASTTKAPVTTVRTTTPQPTTPQPTTPQPTTPQPTTAASTLSQDCIIAKQICSAKCNGKYLVDPSDCTFCICKSAVISGK